MIKLYRLILFLLIKQGYFIIEVFTACFRLAHKLLTSYLQFLSNTLNFLKSSLNRILSRDVVSFDLEVFSSLRLKVNRFISGLRSKKLFSPVSPVSTKTQRRLDARMSAETSTKMNAKADVKTKASAKAKDSQHVLPRSKQKDKKQRLTKDQKPTSTLKKVSIALTFFFLGTLFAVLFITVPALAFFWYTKLPDINTFTELTPQGTTRIMDREGRLLYEIYVDKKYERVSLDQIPDTVIQSTLAIEDTSFYTHKGYDMRGILRAIRENVLKDNLQGGSTITQQLAKILFLTPERTLERKINELALAIKLENKYSKDELLEIYLNNIPYGGTSYGVQSASKKYFGKNVWELNLAEASLLAGLPSAPSAYSPLLGHMTVAKWRQKQVLDQMVRNNYITRQAADEAFKTPLVYASQREFIRAPHFVEFVREELYRTYGKHVVDFQGLEVITTLDLDLQDVAEKYVRQEVANGHLYGFSNGAAIVLDPQQAEILAYVGSYDFFDPEYGKFDVLRSYRQPGSSIKPITYALSFEKGFSPASVVDDTPITYRMAGETYTPKNYDSRFHGRMTFRKALANSYNVPAVKVLNMVGADAMVTLGNALGLQSWTPGDGTYGLSVTLGGKEVRLMDLANAYATFTRKGVYKQLDPFIKITTLNGKAITNLYELEERKVLSPESSYLVTSILSDNNARADVFGHNSKLVIPGHTVAIKTGTTNDVRDNLAIGYTPKYLVGVWVGNNDNTPMRRVASGLTGASPIWNNIMTELLRGTPDEKFDVPSGIVRKSDNSCGVTEYFVEGSSIPNTLCPVFEDKDDDRNGNSEND